MPWLKLLKKLITKLKNLEKNSFTLLETLISINSFIDCNKWVSYSTYYDEKRGKLYAFKWI